MNRSREALQADVSAFLAAGGVVIQHVCSHPATNHSRPLQMTRNEAIAYRKRLDGLAIHEARTRKQGGGS